MRRRDERRTRPWRRPGRRGFLASTGRDPSRRARDLSPTSFEVARSEFVCIVGASGCGKTTLLRAPASSARPGGQVRHRRPHRTQPSREVAFVFQDYGRALLPWRTVQGNVSLALEAAGVAVAQHARRIAGCWPRSA